MFGDLITTNHKVLNKICQSRNNFRYAVVVQDLATQWIQSYPNKKPKVIYTDNSLGFGKHVCSVAALSMKDDGQILWNGWYTCLRNVKDLLSVGRTPFERRFGKPFDGPFVPSGSLAECHSISAKNQSKIHQCGKKVFLGLLFGYALHAG